MLAFALVPRSFLYLVMGGGLTRSLGLLCGVMALHQVHALYTRREWRFAAGAAAACALTVLSHLSTAHFVAWSAALLFLTTAAPLFPVVWLLGLLGAFVCLRPGRILLPVWWVGTTVVDPRAG